MVDMKNRNEKVLKNFIAYCEQNPDQRFWQALRNWSGKPFILTSKEPPFNFPGDWNGIPFPQDTFYWEGKTE